MGWRAALGRLWCNWFHLGDVERDPSGRVNWHCRTCGRWAVPVPPVALLELPARLRFDWLRDYGPHWEPGDTAFWLEPSTCDELASWYAKYRPEETGFKEAAGLRIEIVPAPPPSPYGAMLAAHKRRMAILDGMGANQLQQARGSILQNAANNPQQLLNSLFGRGLFP